MRIFLAGATGVIGHPLVEQMIKDGHQVTALVRRADQAERLRAAGAAPVRADVFDRGALMKAVAEASPDAVMHQLTSLGTGDLAANSAIRVTGTRNLVDAARAAGVRRIVAQSIAFAYAPGDGPADEQTPLDVYAPAPRATTVEGVKSLETAVREVGEWVVLRYGSFYGEGTSYDAKGPFFAQAQRGELRATPDVTSFVHVDDAAAAAALALTWPTGIYNVVDDEPAAGTDWVPAYCASIDAPPPPVSTDRNAWARGASNQKARSGVGWAPAYPSWRSAFSAA